MNKLIIREYMNRISRDDIIRFSNSQGIMISDWDVDLIYKYIRNDSGKILSHPEIVLDEIRGKLDDNVYSKILELYNKYKDKIF